MSRGFAPPESVQDTPADRAVVEDFKAYLRSLHQPVSNNSDTVSGNTQHR